MRLVILAVPVLLALAGCVSVYGEAPPEKQTTVVTPPPSGAPVVVTRP